MKDIFIVWWPVKRSRVITPVVNLNNPSCTGDDTLKRGRCNTGQTLRKVLNSGISDRTKRTDVLRNFFKKYIKKGIFIFPLQDGKGGHLLIIVKKSTYL